MFQNTIYLCFSP